MTMQRKPQVALVTGGATGIGRAVALACARRGLTVAVNYSRSRQDAEQTLAEVRHLGVPAELYACNIADDAAVRKMVAQCREDLGGLDVPVNNAATTHFISHTDLERSRTTSGTRSWASTSRALFIAAELLAAAAGAQRLHRQHHVGRRPAGHGQLDPLLPARQPSTA